MSRARLGLLAGLVLLGAPVSAQPPAVGTAFGAWRLGCEAVAVGETACFLVQTLIRADTGALLAELLALPSPGAGAVLVARVPLGVHLPGGLHLADPDAGRLNFAWLGCSTALCEATLQLDADAVARLDAAAGLRLSYRPVAGVEVLAFDTVLSGLADGLAVLRNALPGTE